MTAQDNQKPASPSSATLSVTEGKPPLSHYGLWKFFRENHDLTLTDSELDDIICAVHDLNEGDTKSALSVTEAHPKEEKPFADWQDDPEKVKAHAEFTADVSAARKKEASSEPVNLPRQNELGPRTLDAKWLDPACWYGCQSLVFKGLLTEIREAVEGERGRCLTCDTIALKLDETPSVLLGTKSDSGSEYPQTPVSEVPYVSAETGEERELNAIRRAGGYPSEHPKEEDTDPVQVRGALRWAETGDHNAGPLSVETMQILAKEVRRLRKILSSAHPEDKEGEQEKQDLEIKEA